MKKILRKLVCKNLQARKLDKLFSSYIHCIDYYVNRNALFVVTRVISSSIVLTSEVYEKKMFLRWHFRRCAVSARVRGMAVKVNQTKQQRDP